MKNLDKSDFQLIEKAKQAIKNNYDEKSFLHTVGAALKCKNGNIYVGVNVYSIHGACAEQVALGSAITAGERNFEAIVLLMVKMEKLCHHVEIVVKYFPIICLNVMLLSKLTIIF